MKLKTREVKAYERFLYNRGRDLEVAKYNYLFNDGDRCDVAIALTTYLNRDGGFGHGLDPDLMNPYSSPSQTNVALTILKYVGYDESNLDEEAEYLIMRALHYVYYYALKDGKINPNVETNNNYPHASWYSYDENFFNDWRYYPMASLIAHTLHFTKEDNKYYKKALPYVNTIITSFINDENVTKHYVVSMIELYDVMKRKNICVELIPSLYEAIEAKIEKMICKDKTNFADPSSNTPLELLKHDDFVNSEERRKLIEDNLDYLLESRLENGLFEINWNWGNDYEEFELQKIKWMGIILVDYLYFFKRFEMIED